MSSLFALALSTSFLYKLPWVGLGVFSLVFPTTVVKTPGGRELSQEQLAVERRIYERLGSHPRITTLISIYEGSIVLERRQYPLRKRLWDLRDKDERPDRADLLRWPSQMSLGLQHAHSCRVFQVDIGAHNVLLDWEDNLKLPDFAGASIDGSNPTILPSS